MKKLFFSCLCLSLISSKGFSQNTDGSNSNYIRPTAIGVSFFMNDFTTAQRIRSTSLSTVLLEKSRAKLKEMSPGMAITYFKGLKKHIDFAGTLAGSFVKIPLDNNTPANDKFLLEADAAVDLKMFSEKYLFTPYIHLGVGVSKYGSSFGTFLPVGGGLKLNLFNEAAIFITSQYRIPLTRETNGYHFMHSFGIAGNIGGK